MVLDYSKWDNLELSDDSDIEVHPNVDKRSFIRAKQNQIHMERERRKHEIATLRYERQINDGLMIRIDRLLQALRKHADKSRNPDELVFHALFETTGDPAEDQPPPRPEGVYAKVDNNETSYSKMMAALVDQVKNEVDESKAADRFEAYLKAIEGHKTKVESLQKELITKLSELEKEEGRKITSENIHTGFDSTFIAKRTDDNKTPKAEAKAETVEVLNPGAIKNGPGGASGSEADVEDDITATATAGEEEHIEPTKLGKEFGKLPVGDYRSCLQYISDHPSVVAERETDGLLIQAFNGQLEEKADLARQCVHQALLLQYCRSLGRDGVALFFKRITTKDHQARKVFLDDVNSTYARIRTRAAEIAKEREKNGGDEGGVEQIQLHAVEPGTQINITIPQPNSEDPVEQKARKVFESFPPGLQRALETSSLDEVNKVLGKMSVEEAEEVVGQLGENGMLSLEEQIIDATTEEGQKQLKEIEAKGHERGKQQGTDELTETADPD